LPQLSTRVREPVLGQDGSSSMEKGRNRLGPSLNTPKKVRAQYDASLSLKKRIVLAVGKMLFLTIDEKVLKTVINPGGGTPPVSDGGT